MIQQPRVRTKINDLTRQLPHFGITCLVKPEMNSPVKFLRKMLKLIFLELLIMILKVTNQTDPSKKTNQYAIMENPSLIQYYNT
jgi:hypothetical protein